LANIPAILAGIIIIIGFILGVSMLWPDIKGAPWLPTRMKKVRKMLELANVQPDELIYDLGCGDGRVIVMAARKFGARAVGVEIDPIRYLWCQFLITILGLRKQVKILYGDLFKKDISDADVVFCYLLQRTNDQLVDKLIMELKPDARIVSNTFVFIELPLIDESQEFSFYVYKIGNKERYGILKKSI